MHLKYLLFYIIIQSLYFSPLLENIRNGGDTLATIRHVDVLAYTKTYTEEY